MSGITTYKVVDFFLVNMDYRSGDILKAVNGNCFVYFAKLDVAAEPDTGVKAEGEAVFVGLRPC